MSDFFRRFLHLKAQAPKVSYEQAITQAIKALRVGQLHSHLVRERLRTLEELYDNFWKFSRSEVLHFCKLGQQRKTVNENKGSWPTKYSKSRENTSNFGTIHKQGHSIDSDGCGLSEKWEKNFRPPWLESESRTYTPRKDYNPRGSYSNWGWGKGETNIDLCIACFMRET
jgi:hypothetical protein